MSNRNAVSAVVVGAGLSAAQELEAAKSALYASTEGLTSVQQGQDDSVRRAGLAIGAVHAAFNLYKGNQKGANQCAGWAAIDALRSDMKARIVEIRTKGGKYTEKQAATFFDSTWNAMKGYYSDSLVVPQNSEVSDGAAESTESDGAQTRRTKSELMVEAVIDARARLDKLIADKEATDHQVRASKFLRMAALLVQGKEPTSDLVQIFHGIK